MKRSFTLIELIFVIVIIGLLGSVAIPKFMQTKASASSSSAKSIISSIRTAIETKHGEWIINDNLGVSDDYTPQGYPKKLDESSENSAGENLFVGTSKLSLLKNPVKSCLNNDCWFKYKADNTDKNLSYYSYKFTDESNITLEYNGSNGKISCIDDGGMSKSECESIIE
jgi:prepilin-type N-terminal cleavage/methylation domain-containing protein